MNQPMTPETQSVCKHCADLDRQFAHLKSANTGAWQYRNEHGHWVTCETQKRTPKPPVAEPASTGKPPTVSDGFGSEWPLRCEEDGCDGINQVMRPGSVQCSKEHLHNRAARPSEPSAPQTSAEPKEWLPCSFGCIQQGRYHPNCPWHKRIEVSGDAPKERDMLQEAIRASLAAYFQIKEVAPDRFRIFIDAGAGEKNLSSHYGIEDAMRNRDWLAGRIANRLSHALRPYFPPASQTPTIEQLYEAAKVINSGDVRKDLFALEGLALHRHRDTGEMKYLIEALNCRVMLKNFDSNFPDPLATPASTARTDGWVSVEERLPEIKKVDYDDFSESRFVLIFLKDGREAIAQYCEWQGNKHPSMWDEYSGSSHKTEEVTHWRELPAAPGSVPQAQKGEITVNTQVALGVDHPMMVAWKQFIATAEYSNALKWALRDKYDDGREISPEMRKNHVEGAMWLAFTKHFDEAATPASTARTDGWVSVEERLPKGYVPVLFYTNENNIEMGQIWEDEWVCERTAPQDEPIKYRVQDGQITHWQPLPAAPGSVPQAPMCKCPYAKDQSQEWHPVGSLGCTGVPQAEPPKEEKP